MVPPVYSEHRDGLAEIARLGRFMPPVIVEQLLEFEVLAIGGQLDKLLGRCEARVDRVAVRSHFSDVADDEFLQPGLAEQGLHLRIERDQVERDHKIGLAVFNLVLKNLTGIERRVIDHRAPGLEDRKEADHVVGRIGKVKSDVNAGLNAELLQSGCRAVDQSGKFTVGQCPSHERHGGKERPFRNGVIQDLIDRNGSEVGVPMDTLGVGF